MRKYRGAVSALAWWVTLPILGKIAGLLFPFLMILFRSREGDKLESLKVFSGLCCLYVLYISGTAVLAGANAWEPIEDTLPVLIVASISVLTIRTPMQVKLSLVYKAIALALCLTLALTFLERELINTTRPNLLLGNPLNLAPVLLIPCLFLTFFGFAPNKIWVGIGVLGFCAGLYTIAFVTQARGILLSLGILIVLRLAVLPFTLHLHGAALRIRLFLFGIGGLGVLLGMAGFSALTGLHERYSAIFQTAFQQDPALALSSSGQRIAMIRAGWEAFWEKPWFGYGPQNRFNSAIAEDLGFQYTHLHNDFITHGVAGGVGAVALMTAMLVFPLVHVLRTRAPKTQDFTLFGVLSSLGMLGVAFVNNAYFVAISSFTTTLTLVAVLVILRAIQDET